MAIYKRENDLGAETFVEVSSPKPKKKPEPLKGAETADSAPKKKRKRTEKERFERDLKQLLIKIGIVTAVSVILLVFVGGVALSHDANMVPSVADGDLAITYKLGGYYNGDLIVYEFNGKTRFGRVVGIPGDVIDFGADGRYTVNGIMPMENISTPTYPAEQSQISFPYTVKEGEYFVLNDFRENAFDSRNFGPITNPKGKVVLLIRRRGF